MTRHRRVSFVVNPIAGLGGRVGLKGTDDVVDRALELGAKPVAADRSRRMLLELRRRLRAARTLAPRWLTCSGAMGAEALELASFDLIEVCYESPAKPTRAGDTRAAVKSFLERGAEIVLFCGGDGTARDVASVTGVETPILGIPAGVKMYSGVFGVTPERTAALLVDYLDGTIGTAPAELLDLDEERYRHGEWAVRLYAEARTPFEPSLTQSAKAQIDASEDREAKLAIADQLGELIESEPGALFLLGPGSTVESIAPRLGIEKTLLGIDAVVDGRCIGHDLNEEGILELFGRYPKRRLVLSPLGASGFLIGRGNQPLSPRVLEGLERNALIVVATLAKLSRTPILRFDTGDPAIDRKWVGSGFLPVVVGYHLRRESRVE